jgi:Brp/Blh family beta-carotene 15,15'-monooxygenase
MKLFLLIVGCGMLTLQQLGGGVSPDLQMFLFLAGVVLVGIPHGAADMLVATQRSTETHKHFSTGLFLVGYLCRLFAFAVVLYCFPVVGAALFLLFSAYHFGETDMSGIRTDKLLGKAVVLSYGVVILGIILLGHAEEVKPIVATLQPTPEQVAWMEHVFAAKLLLLGVSLALFFACSFAYFTLNTDSRTKGGELIIRFAVLALLVHFMPLLLGFTFYFVLWHSLISLSDIIHFLREQGHFTMRTIMTRMATYSSLALAGVLVLAVVGSLYASAQAMVVSVVLGLAVLTAPHLGVMHGMYASLRNRR